MRFIWDILVLILLRLCLGHFEVGSYRYISLIEGLQTL